LTFNLYLGYPIRTSFESGHNDQPFSTWLDERFNSTDLMGYIDKLTRAAAESQSLLCIGLDPNPERIPAPFRSIFPEPEKMVVEFCKRVIDVTHDQCCAYKPNLAFFEALGARGLDVFEQVIRHIPNEKMIIADAKRGDIGSTAEQYKIAFFDRFDTDALTLNPMMGFDTLDPFTGYEDKGIYCLTLTSNPGSNDFLLRKFEGRMTMAEYIADQLQRKMEKSRTHIGMVIGATHDQVIQQVLGAYREASLLIPGIGSQGGSVERLIQLLADHKGLPLVSASRSILYAGADRHEWAEDVRASAVQTRKSLEKLTRRYV